jgi:hypothetical protein
LAVSQWQHLPRTKAKFAALLLLRVAEFAWAFDFPALSGRVEVGQADWQDAVNALTQHMREGRIAAGFVAAIQHCGAVLGAHAPPVDLPISCLIAFSSSAEADSSWYVIQPKRVKLRANR